MKKRVLLIASVILLCWVLIFPMSLLFSRYSIGEPTISFYNIFNVLVSALAFAGLVTTLVLQIEQTRRSNIDSIERSVFELFNTFTSDSFQAVKNDAFLCLLIAVRHKPYGMFLTSRLFPVGRLPFPEKARQIYTQFRPELATASDKELADVDRAARLHLDNILNFFSMLAQRQAAHSVIKQVNFAYDWWRPTLLIIAQLQYEIWTGSETVRQSCRTPLLRETLKTLDDIYGYEPLEPGPAVYAYLRSHPWLREEKLDSAY